MTPRFSSRIPGSLKPNLLALSRNERVRIPYDLTVSNPTLCGIEYPEDLLAPLGRAEGLAYLPDPLGIHGAREAVAEEQARHGLAADASSILLTASTSEAYALLFKLLCDPGERVLVPTPSYPLFEHLCALEGVHALAYPLDSSGGWQPDLAAVDATGARALVLVHPNNPTGTWIDDGGARDVARFCSSHGLALIADEVFREYALGAPPLPSFRARSDTLVFTLGGLSKYLGLPQLKLAWTLVTGPRHEVEDALERLSFIADNYLSVGTPVQLALRHLFLAGASVRDAIRSRCLRNLEFLDTALRGAPDLALVRPQAGWSAVLRFPNVIAEESLALELMEQDGVVVHPGYFFDFPEPGYLALSLLPQPEIFREGVLRMLHRIAQETSA